MGFWMTEKGMRMDETFLFSSFCFSSFFVNELPSLIFSVVSPPPNGTSFFLPFNCSLLWCPQPIICLHLTLSCASSSLTPTDSMFSISASINLLFALPLQPQHPSTDVFTTLSKPSQSGWRMRNKAWCHLSSFLHQIPLPFTHSDSGNGCPDSCWGCKPRAVFPA